MRDKEEFFSILTEIDGEDIREYARLVGDFDFSRYVLKVNRVQNPDVPDSQPSLFVIRVTQNIAGFPPHLFNTPVRRTGLEDLLTRKVAEQIEALARYDAQGVSRRRLSVATPGQKILPRSSMIVTDEYVEARIYGDLPQVDGRVAGEPMKDLFFDDLPAVVNNSLIYCNLDERQVETFVDLMEDADQVRQMLPTRGWVSFVAEGVQLCRLEGSDLPDPLRDTPLAIEDNLMTEVDIPNAGTVRGLGVPNGVTLILGDAHSGRAELAAALAAGIYNHIPGDGRELIVTVPDAVHVAAEKDRSVRRVDVSAFVRKGAEGTDPRQYTASRADACSAQAAAAVEALEVGARVLLFDEADSDPGFLSRDRRLHGLLGSEQDAIVPLAARARQLADELGVSIVVAGASSVAELIPVADTVFRIRDFRVEDITAQAKEAGLEALPPPEDGGDIGGLLEKARWVVPSSIDPSAGRQDAYIEAPLTELLEFGRSAVDLSALKQLADVYQTSTIGLILYYAKLRYMDEGRPVREILDLVDRDLSTEGLECLTRDLRGDLARPRRYEIAAALNRLDTLRISHAGE